jgi:hypothetical protein
VSDYIDLARNVPLSKNPVVHHDAKKNNQTYLEAWLFMDQEDKLKIPWLKWLLENPTVNFNRPSYVRNTVGEQILGNLPLVAIFQACDTGDLDLAMQVVNRVSLNETTLSEVVRQGDLKFIKLLFEDEEVQSKFRRRSFLSSAFSTGNLELVKYFLPEEAFLPEQALPSEDELIVAGEEGSLEIVTYLLNLLRQNEEIDTQSKVRAMLVGAVRKGNYESVKHIFADYPTVIADDAIDDKRSLLVAASGTRNAATLNYLCDRFKMEPNKACVIAAVEAGSQSVLHYLSRRLNLSPDWSNSHLLFLPSVQAFFLKNCKGLESLE